MKDWVVTSKEELIISVSESNDNREIGLGWICADSSFSLSFCIHSHFITNDDNDTVGYRGMVASREEVNYYSKTGGFTHLPNNNSEIQELKDKIKELSDKLEKTTKKPYH